MAGIGPLSLVKSNTVAFCLQDVTLGEFSITQGEGVESIYFSYCSIPYVDVDGLTPQKLYANRGQQHSKKPTSEGLC